jgi:hypothetical protein
MLHAQVHAAQVDVDDAVPFVVIEVGDEVVGLFDSGVVECRVEAAVGGDRVLEG